MRIVIFIPTASVYNNQPGPWLKERLEAANQFYNENIKEVVGIVVSGRWSNVTETYDLTESEVSKQCLINLGINSEIIFKEDISVETGGNFAFSKPIISSLSPDRVVIFNSKVNQKRVKFLAEKIFGNHWDYQYYFSNDEFSKNKRAQKKEPKALKMFQRLFEEITNGDDATARNILLYKTPFYYKGHIDDKRFFDTYWPGGFNDFREKRLSIHNR